jgi:endonuclease YncB( thermonuclease family)
VTEWLWPGSRVVRVLDGDTVDVLVTRDLGFGGVVMFPIRLRLNRINASPLHTPTGLYARGYLASLIPMDVSLTLSTLDAYKYGAPAGQTGEWMAEITTPDGRNASDVMVSDGHAVYWTGQGPRPGG